MYNFNLHCFQPLKSGCFMLCCVFRNGLIFIIFTLKMLCLFYFTKMFGYIFKNQVFLPSPRLEINTYTLIQYNVELNTLEPDIRTCIHSVYSILYAQHHTTVLYILYYTYTIHTIRF